MWDKKCAVCAVKTRLMSAPHCTCKQRRWVPSPGVAARAGAQRRGLLFSDNCLDQNDEKDYWIKFTDWRAYMGGGIRLNSRGLPFLSRMNVITLKADACTRSGRRTKLFS